MSVPTQSLPIDAKTLIAEVEKQTTAAVSAMQGKLLTEIAKTISDAVDKKYTVVVGRLGTEKKDSHAWQVGLVILPIVMTVGLGWWVTKAQTEITKKIDDQKQDLTTRLALTQEYQKRKLDMYQSCTKSMNALSQALEALRIDPQDQKPASNAIHNLYDCSQNNSLYVTKNVAGQLETVQTDAIAVMQNARNGEINMTTFEADVVAAQKLMLDELTGVTVQLNLKH